MGVAGSVVAIFVLAVLGMGLVKTIFPTSDRPEVLVEVQMPYGTSIRLTSSSGGQNRGVVTKQPEAKMVTAYIGRGSPRFYLAMAPSYPTRRLPDSGVDGQPAITRCAQTPVAGSRRQRTGA